MASYQHGYNGAYIYTWYVQSKSFPGLGGATQFPGRRGAGLDGNSSTSIHGHP